MFKIIDVMSELECYKKLRKIRWPDSQIQCPRCSSTDCSTVGRSTEENPNQRYRCEACGRYFNDLSDTLFQSSNVSLKSWMCCLYLMGLNSSNRQIAQELEISEKTAQNMTKKIRIEVKKNTPHTALSGEVEFDEVYVVAGHKGQPDAIKKREKSP